MICVFFFWCDFWCDLWCDLRCVYIGACAAQWLKNGNTKYASYTWEKAATDASLQYNLSYHSGSAGIQTVLTYARTKEISDYDWNRGLSALVSFFLNLCMCVVG